MKPPLVEFEETLFSGAGAAMAAATFRTMDPGSHRMIGVRADMTPQIARIAATRLGNAARPLRLSYAGQVLRVKGSEIRPERQIGQVGAELIGAVGPAADVEAIAVAGEGLSALGVRHLSVDITLPTLVPAVVEALAFPASAPRRCAPPSITRMPPRSRQPPGTAGELLGRLLAAAGPAEAALAALDCLDLPPQARPERARLGAVLDGLRDAAPGSQSDGRSGRKPRLRVSYRDQLYIFAWWCGLNGSSGELGRGGRYQAGDPAAPEPATGFTLYTDTVLQTLPQSAPATPPAAAARHRRRARAAALREEGWITVAALEPAADWRAEARRLGCSHILEDGAPQAPG